MRAMERIDGGRGVAVLIDGKALDLGLRTRNSFERILPEADVRIAGPGDLPDVVHGMLSHRPSILLVVGSDRTAAAALAVLRQAGELFATLTPPRVALATWSGFGPSFSPEEAEALLARLPAFGGAPGAAELPTAADRLLAATARFREALAGSGDEPAPEAKGFLGTLRRAGWAFRSLSRARPSFRLLAGGAASAPGRAAAEANQGKVLAA
jgi:hypothetical protein